MSHWSSGLTVCFSPQGAAVRARGVQPTLWNWDYLLAPSRYTPMILQQAYDTNPGPIVVQLMFYVKNNFTIKRTVHKMIENQAKSRTERPYELLTNSQARKQGQSKLLISSNDINCGVKKKQTVTFISAATRIRQ
jgi:hypothetical protein